MPDVIGFVSGVLGIWSFVQGLFPSKPDIVFAAVRVCVGLGGTPGFDGPLNSPEGVLKSYSQWDFVDIIMDQGVSQQAPYVQIRNGDGERTCIAYVTVTFNDGQNRGWDGTWAEQMPEPVQWYYSGVILDGSTAPGKCLWMNEDVGTLMIYMPAFAPGPDKSVNPDLNHYFGTAGFRAYKFNDRVGELALAPGWPSRKEKRGAVAAAAAQPQRKKKRAPDSRLVITDQPGHSAAELCGSHSSHGPSLVSLVEGLFCNMKTREVLPICAGELTEGCFEVPDTKAVHGQSANASASAQAAGNSGILDWTIKARR
ncbi:hypothetical protein QBC37DRAFT_488177 [Rhypophila decipiens]|uniref:Uncharacterized protein n=1 Tax=Rhypophila decipiens TaxID=261697 RepID=A0AAN6XSX3_9PEZI|nr:hypothetical protein QBC37DRAFT_488177 [Rhypophila decipiens]